MTQLSSVIHVSPNCVKLVFDGPMRNNADLRDATKYGVSGNTIVRVEIEYAQSQPYVSSSQLGGAPVSVYLVCEDNISDGGALVGVSFAIITLRDFAGALLSGSSSKNVTTHTFKDITYWTADGIRTQETFDEYSRLGRAKWTLNQPLNYSTAHMVGKINDLMSGGLRAILDGDIEGPAEPTRVATFSGAGYASSMITIPGVGSTITFKDGIIPCHVDKLWGSSNGSNRLFRTSNAFHTHACVLIVSEGTSDSPDKGIMDNTRWYAPNSGYDRQIILEDPLPVGATIIAVYVPRRSLLAIGHEIIAYEESDIVAGTAIIYGRAQLMSQLEEHKDGDYMEDVWGASFLKRAEYNTLAMGASGRALEYIGLDSGSPRSDNPTLQDLDLRRMIYHTSVTMRGVPGTVKEGIRYIYPRLWSHIIVEEDPRWPACYTIWFSEDTIIGDLTWITSPNVEPWETWLDELSWTDGMPLGLMAETYYRDDAIDDGTYGDYFLEDFTEDPAIWPYPVVLSGSIVGLLGASAPVIPDPASVSSGYRSYLVRPPGLDKVLPAGCGVLLLDISLL